MTEQQTPDREKKIAEIREALEKATQYKEFSSLPGYLISSTGEVISYAHNWRGYGARILKQDLNSHGYPRVRLVVGGKRKSFLVHKLVAEAFLPPRPSEYHEIRHLDGNKQNNSITNLAWGTRKENAADREVHGRTAKGSKNGWSKLDETKVRDIKRLSQEGVPGCRIAEMFGVSKTNIYYILSGKAWKHVKIG